MLTCFTHIIGKYPKTVYTLSEDDLENLSLDKWIELYSIAKERSRKKEQIYLAQDCSSEPLVLLDQYKLLGSRFE